MKLKYLAIIGSVCLIGCVHKPIPSKKVTPDSMLGSDPNGTTFQWGWLDGGKPGHGIISPPDPPKFDPEAPVRHKI